MRLFLLLGLTLLVSCGGPSKKTSDENVAKKDTIEDASIKFVTLEVAVGGMTCEGCENTVKKTVAAIPGVTSVEASHTDKKAIIKYEEGKVEKTQIEKAIEGAGYEIIKE